MTRRIFALVGPLPEQQTVNRWVDADGNVTLMPNPQLLIVVGDSDSAMLYAYTTSGELAGDSWGENVEYAQRMAALTYGSALGEWREIPDDAPHAIAYALACANDAASGEGGA